MSENLKQTAIHSWHESHGAKMVEFGGWHMPLNYPSGAVTEHRATRTSAGLFDISHMGRVEVRGVEAAEYLDYLVSSNIGALALGASTYGLLCRPDGGIIDDVFVFRIAQNHFVVVINAANREKDLEWMKEHLPSNVMMDDQTENTSMFALQGPKAIDIISQVVGTDLSGLDRFAVMEHRIGSSSWYISRTGYTGEDGVEVILSSVDSMEAWTALAEPSEVTPVGLAARDSLRFEPGFALYGHEIDETRDPVEARLTWACDLDTPFIGRDAIAALKEQGSNERLATFVMKQKGVPRQGYRVLSEDGLPIGTVVTGMYAPTLDVFAGNAYLPLEYSKIGSTIAVEVRNRPIPAEVVKRPLYRPAYRG